MTPKKPPSAWQSLAMGLAPGVPCFLLGTIPLLPGPRALQDLALLGILLVPFFVFPLLTAILALPFFGIVALRRANRSWAGRAGVLCLGMILGLLPALKGVFAVRDARFEAATRRAAPLIQAIEAHQAATGRWPDTLETLAPSRIAEIPGTGLMAYPSFTYQRADDESLFKSYQLMVQCGAGVLNFDVFVYWPEGNYPDFMYSGSVERVGGWAYVHE